MRFVYFNGVNLAVTTSGLGLDLKKRKQQQQQQQHQQQQQEQRRQRQQQERELATLREAEDLGRVAAKALPAAVVNVINDIHTSFKASALGVSGGTGAWGGGDPFAGAGTGTVSLGFSPADALPIPTSLPPPPVVAGSRSAGAAWSDRGEDALLDVVVKTDRDGWVAARRSGRRELYVLLPSALSPEEVAEAVENLSTTYFRNVIL